MMTPRPSDLRGRGELLRGAHITPGQINALPLYRYNGQVILIEDDTEARRAISDLERETVLGFDTESRPSFEKGRSFPVALVQLAAANKAYIFRLGALSDLNWFPRLFSVGHLVKAGVGVGQDVAKLREQHPFEPAGFVDIAHLAARLGVKNRGIRGLAALFFGVRVSKSMRRSNWDRIRLSSQQITYAATDAWLCRELYLYLDRLWRAQATDSNAQRRDSQDWKK